MKEVIKFENKIAEFYGAPYAVATDSCTHALELCLRYLEIKKSSCPRQTYISVPFNFIKLGIEWEFKNELWEDFYFLGNTDIVDAAVYWKKNGYIEGTYMCLSFQFKKHLNLGRGGAILVNDLQSYSSLKKMSYDGRDPIRPWAEQNIKTIGYHYYMTPETATMGLEKLSVAMDTPAKKWNHNDYPDISKMSVFNE